MQAFNDQANPPPQSLSSDFDAVTGMSATKVLRVLAACEFSGIVRDAFLKKGHDAWSCDLLPAEHNSNRHIQGDVRDILKDGWDFLIVAHPPCTRLCNSGVRWLHKPPPGETIDQMWKDLREGAALFWDLWNAPIPHICVENPVMHSHAKKLIRNYVEFSQSVQPWQFGHPETKRTCSWLKNLPPLRPTMIVEGRTPRVHRMPPSPDRWRDGRDSFRASPKRWLTSGKTLRLTPLTIR
jgi:hypothetical protein